MLLLTVLSISSNTNFLIRKDVYEAIGEPDFGTPEEFVAAMEMIDQEFPELGQN